MINLNKNRYYRYARFFGILPATKRFGYGFLYIKLKPETLLELIKNEIELYANHETIWALKRIIGLTELKCEIKMQMVKATENYQMKKRFISIDNEIIALEREVARLEREVIRYAGELDELQEEVESKNSVVEVVKEELDRLIEENKTRLLSYYIPIAVMEDKRLTPNDKIFYVLLSHADNHQYIMGMSPTFKDNMPLNEVKMLAQEYLRFTEQKAQRTLDKLLELGYLVGTKGGNISIVGFRQEHYFEDLLKKYR
jgi:hypothetical protein